MFRSSFASHIVSTPWQQSWATLKLLEYCINKHGGDFKSDVFSMSDITNVRKEVDFQYTLRNYAADGFVQVNLCQFLGRMSSIFFVK